MKWLHCADFHIGSVIEAKLSTDKAQVRRREITEGFGSMLDYAEQNGIEAVLIAGDLFDNEKVSARTLSYVTEQMRRHDGLAFYYLRGNHDNRMEVSFPDNVHTFSDEGWQYYTQNGMTVAGTEMPLDSQGLYESLQLPPEGGIVLLHGMPAESGTVPEEEKVRLRLLQKKNIRYLALGHIHSFATGKLGRSGVWCQSGCPNGRGFDECGEKGFCVYDDETGELRFVPHSDRVLWSLDVDVSACADTYAAEATVEAALCEPKKEDIVRVRLTGKRDIHLRFDTAYLTRALGGRFFWFSCEDKTGISTEGNAYENDLSLRGFFVRQVMESRLTEDEKREAIEYGLRALDGEDL